MKVRHLRPAENWPDTLFMGFEGPQLDREWCWVVEDETAVQAGLLTCPMHGVVFLLRLAAAVGAPRLAIRTLFSEALKEVKAKGYVGYTTLIDESTPEGKRLNKLVKRTGGLQWPRPMVLAFGTFAGMERL
jgi:hypothetical protein